MEWEKGTQLEKSRISLDGGHAMLVMSLVGIPDRNACATDPGNRY